MRPISLTRASFLGLTAIALCVGLTPYTARADIVGTPVRAVPFSVFLIFRTL
jgi:hypothetical protein